MALADLDLALRPARADEADFFFAVRRAGFQPYVERAFGPWIETVQRGYADRDFAELPVEIIEERGAPIGYLIVVGHPDHMFLDEIALLPSAQRRGLGSALVRLVMARAEAAGLSLRLSVLAVNPAQRLYERLGFVVTRIEPPRVKMAWRA